MANGEERMAKGARVDETRDYPLLTIRYSLFAIRYSHPMAETILNLRGLKCPLPALKARKALTKLSAGDMLVLECTDPLSTIDIPNLVRETGDVLEASARDAALFVFRIRKS
jgi:tRNA 2-thiouridine synthesizing protein A